MADTGLTTGYLFTIVNPLSHKAQRKARQRDSESLEDSDTSTVTLNSMSLQFSPQESGSDFASIVDVDLCEALWKKVVDKDFFALLHAKFWGKSMAIEEQEWQSHNPSMGGNKDRDGDDPMEEDVVESLDEGFEMDDDGEIIPGCYPLDIGGDVSPIWIRADYIRIYNYLEVHYKKPPTPFRAPAAVITGQPGVGKTMWIYYALRRRLAEKMPVILYRNQRFFLFVDEGVYREPPDFESRHFKTFVWTLVDSDESQDGVPPRLVSHGTHHYVIYTTSPRKERWSRLHKTTRDITVIMNPWTRNEIFRAASLLLPESLEFARISWIYDHLGPTPRLCLELSTDSKQLKEYEYEVEMTVKNVTRERRDVVFSRTITAPITPFIQSRLANQFGGLEQAERICMYKRFEKFPGSRAMAGIFFEAAAQQHLQDGTDLELLPMVQLTTSRKGSLPQWCSSHSPIDDASLEAFRQQALQQRFVITVRPSRTIEYPDAGLSLIAPDVFYVPESSNQVAFDSFIVINGLLYIFQFTIASVHDIKPGLIDLLGKCQDLPPMDNWRIVFVIPPNLTLMAPQPRLLEMRELKPYSSVIEFEGGGNVVLGL